jgi:phosphoribosylformimino-5-aminoimidazole carboxamide ribotide isomerase
LILYPAIDLKDGACVRLMRGEMQTATVYNRDPADQARRFAAQGFSWLHVVDLDGAFAGHPANREAVRAILTAVKLPVQLGGGIRDRAALEFWLRAGVTRVVLGTAAVREPAFVREAARAHPNRIALGLDAKGGKVAVEGWAATATLTPAELARRFEDAGVAAIIHTDIARDGTGQGLNVEATLALAEAVSIPVIASGGVGGIEDIRRAKAARPIAGVICGRALYDGRLDARAALALAGSS